MIAAVVAAAANQRATDAQLGSRWTRTNFAGQDVTLAEGPIAVVALLAAFALWSGHWTIAPIRAAAAVLVGCVGAVAGWGNWRGRPMDRWVTDLGLFVLATYRVRWRRQ